MEIKNNKILIKKEGKKCFFEEEEDYCIWDPTKSKIAAAVIKGLELELLNKKYILYLGASYGYTLSRLSLLFPQTKFFSVEVAKEPFAHLLEICEEMNNIVPILEDANKPEKYDFIPRCDVIIQDVAQKNQTEILIKNVKKFLRKGGTILYSLKTKAIDATKNKKEVLEGEVKILEKEGLNLVKIYDISEFEKEHYLLLLKY